MPLPAHSAPTPHYYSHDARAFISQFPFQPHHANSKANPSSSDFLQVGTFLADFERSPAQAVEVYKDWKQSLWFAPEAFLDLLEPHQLTPLWIPFYTFSLFTHSTHHGKAGFFKKLEEGPSELGTIEFDWAPSTGSTTVHFQHHPDVLAYAPSLAPHTLDYDLIKDIWYWKLDNIRPHTFAQTQALPHSLPMHQPGSLDVKFLHPTTVSEGWTHAQRRLLRNEKYCAAQTLKRELSCDVVDNVQTETLFSHIAVKLVYLPVYMWSHTYLETTYYTVMNAQNGLICSTRPYALKGSFETAIKVLTGGSLNDGDSCETLRGIDLATRDNFLPLDSPYRADLHYLIFPPSDQFLVLVAIGWLRIRNTSSDSVELVAQRRISPHLGKSLVLEKGEEKVVAYRGAWCLCITRGDPRSVVLAHVSTNSGADKDDLMGMV